MFKIYRVSDGYSKCRIGVSLEPVVMGGYNCRALSARRA